MKQALTLIVCSNRANIAYGRIWKQIIGDRRLAHIILVTQGAANMYTNNQPKVQHIKHSGRGRSNAINTALRYIHTPLVGLTDDDCILTTDWVVQGMKSMRDPIISMVFGRTLPYRPALHRGQICPCTYTKPAGSPQLIRHITHHWISVGYDNNVMIRKHVFDKIGGYTWWLGPGSLGRNAEDAEFILRSLIDGQPIGYNPNMLAYHDKWLNPDQAKKQELDYLVGGVAAYAYHGLRGEEACAAIAYSYWKQARLRTKLYAAYGYLIAFLFARVIRFDPREHRQR